MRALLTAEIVRNMGVVLLKPGSELMHLFAYGRVLVERPPATMGRLPSGRIPDARQPLAENIWLIPFFNDQRVINAAGGIPALEYWLEQNVTACQYPHSDYHHHEMVNLRHPPGSICVCWHCDNILRDQTTSQLESIAQKNIVSWIIETILRELRCSPERELSAAELCWWAIVKDISDAITEPLARQGLCIPEEPIPSVYRECDISPEQPATSILAQKIAKYEPAREPIESVISKPEVMFKVDAEPPASFFRRPKRIRWENPKYLSWVKSQPCECCQQQADDPHHLIGHGQGGMATKAHDVFTIPLCRQHHTELHNDPVKFEHKYGSQLEMLKNVLDRAFALGVLA